jgi:Na+:H+ antiporter, NhaA family
LGAIIIIAVFYTNDLTYLALAAAGVMLLGLIALNLLRIRSLAPYAVLGVILWVCLLKSGVHATLAGVACALAIPLKVPESEERGEAPLRRLEHALHPWVAFAIMPLFGFANAGVSFAGTGFESLVESLPLGIALGLFLGKQAGAFGLSWLAIRLGLARPPQGASMAGLYGTCMIAGIGFTMSLFIGTLAFPGPDTASAIRLGVLIGSGLSALGGLLVLMILSPARADSP